MRMQSGLKIGRYPVALFHPGSGCGHFLSIAEMAQMGQGGFPSVIEALTTIFTPPTDCSPGPTFTLGNGKNDSFIFNSSYLDTFIHGYTSSCLPTAALDIIYDLTNYAGAKGYSPGLCPSGWATASAAYSPPQTTAFCCPEGWNVYTTGNYRDFNCTSGPSDAFVISGDLTTTYTTNNVILMRGIAVTQADSDKALLASATAPSSTTTSTSTAPNSDSSSLSTTATPGASVSSGTAPTATNPEPEPGPGLSTGAKAGIGVGAAIGALLVIGIVIFVLWRKRRQRKATPDQSPLGSSDKFEKAELSGEPKQVPELKATNLYEADGTGRPGEMSNANVRAELEGDWRGWEVPGHGSR
ncbi:hypothetical protein HII31_13008 [Pseudocercospora fuligena]|uniref:Uncharacterized protein n=1 Tax=Pseudocercospora fuligena TaxID=685502 RepID=A0A8H6VCK1_9PEZI|nr:hypothetical protein HII31_13008 [Pseudocercospora fuligena]